MKIFTLGNGFIANNLSYPIIKDRIFPNISSINDIFYKYKPDVLINCIGRTGNPNIDWCETHKEETSIANTIIPTILAHAANNSSMRLIHISSGCIFYGKSPNIHTIMPSLPYQAIARKSYTEQEKKDYKPIYDREIEIYDPNAPKTFYNHGWKESDIPNPQSFYSKSKYAAELAISDLPNTTILRIHMPISKKSHPKNLLQKICSYKSFIDVPNSITFLEDLSKTINFFANNSIPGTFHAINPGSISAIQIAQEFKKYFKELKCDTIPEEQLNYTTKHSNCILQSKLHDMNLFTTPAHSIINEYVKCFIANSMHYPKR